MPSDFRGNFVHVRLTGRGKRFPAPWVRDDTRLSCVLVLGDGFTQGFLRHHGLDTVVPSNVAAHFTPGKRYLPVSGDRFGPHPSELLDERKWPRLLEAWRAYGHSDDPYGFYQACASERINPTLDQGLWTFNTNALAYQLRAYLWHFFVSFQMTVDAHMHGRDLLGPDSWLWARLIRLLDMDFRLAVITFNYDLVALRILSMVIQGGIARTVEAMSPPFENGHVGRCCCSRRTAGSASFSSSQRLSREVHPTRGWNASEFRAI